MDDINKNNEINELNKTVSEIDTTKNTTCTMGNRTN